MTLTLIQELEQAAKGIVANPTVQVNPGPNFNHGHSLGGYFNGGRYQSPITTKHTKEGTYYNTESSNLSGVAPSH